MPIITEELKYLATQNIRDVRIKVNLLDYQFNNVAQIEGNLVEMPSFTINANSDIRRTCNVSIIPKDASFDIKEGNKIWLDKYVQILYGQKNMVTKQYTYTNMGIYMINNPQRVYSVTENTLTFQGIDLMARLTGMRNGNLEGIAYSIPQGSNVRSAIIATLEMFGFTRHECIECDIPVPNDIEMAVGSTAYAMLKELRDILPNYQMYFDVDGVFHYDKVPLSGGDTVMVDDTIWRKNLISYQKTTDFESLKNVIEVIGKEHADFTQVSRSNNVLALPASKTALVANEILAWEQNTAETITTSKTLTIGSQAMSVVSDDLTTPPAQIDAGLVCVQYLPPRAVFDIVDSTTFTKTYTTATIETDAWGKYLCLNDSTGVTANAIVKFEIAKPANETSMFYPTRWKFVKSDSASNGYFGAQFKYGRSYIMKRTDETSYRLRYLGKTQPHAIVKETNPDSPFKVSGNLGEIRIVLNGGEFDNISSDELAKERAEWELYQRCRLLDNIVFESIPIPWLDVNWLIEVTLPNKGGEEVTEKYIIDSINISSGINGTMSVSAHKWYSFYED